jgi:predicted dehydrogenase
MSRRVSRRRFLQAASFVSAAAAGLPAWFVEESRSYGQDPKPTTSPNDRPRVALIGCGGRGMALSKEAKPYADVVAVCDVDEKHVANGAYEHKGAAEYHDFRKAIAHKGLDAVLCATPDHWHTLVNLHAMRQGKDVYSEKPLTLTIDEGKHVVRTSRETRRILQTGSQQRSDARFRLACELVRNGRVGKLKQVMVAIPAGPGPNERGPFKPAPVPKELDWEMWQGQTPEHEYVPQRCHFTFRYWYDYSGGTVTDWGAHHNDIALWGMGQERSGPTTIEAKPLSEMVPGGYTAFSDYRIVYTWPNGIEHVCYSERYDNGTGGPVSNPAPGETHHGVKFIGSDGWIYVTRGKIEASNPDLLKQELPASAERLYVSRNHMGNFIECMRTRKPPIAEAEIGHRSVSVCHLGNIALRLGRKLTWDPKAEAFVGDDEAQRFLARTMRKPWSYEAV